MIHPMTIAVTNSTALRTISEVRSPDEDAEVSGFSYIGGYCCEKSVVLASPPEEATDDESSI